MRIRRIQPSIVLPVFILVFGLLLLIASGVTILTLPSQTKVAMWLLVAGILFCFGSFVASPTLFKDIFTSRKSLLWLNDIFLIVAMIGIGVLVSYIGFRRHYRVDLTRDKLFSISDSTIKLVRGMTKDVQVTAFFISGALDGGLVKDLLDEYKRNTDRLTYKFIDPQRDPITTKTMNVTALGTIIVQCGENRKDIPIHELFIQPPPYMRGKEPPKFQGEQALTSAIMNVTSGERRRILFSKGHEEAGLDQYEGTGYARVKAALVKENYVVDTVNLMDGIPTDTAVLGIASPKTAFHADEIKNLREFLTNRNGKLFVALDPERGSPEFEALLTEVFGIIPNNEIVISPQRVNQNPALVIPTYEHHVIVKDQLAAQSGVLMQLARGLSFEGKEPWTISPFLKAREDCYGKRNMDDLRNGRIQFDPQTDVKGPLNLGIAVETRTVATGTRAVIFGDSDFASNMLIGVQGNSDLLVNTFNWLAREEAKISIRPKTIDIAPINITQDEIQILFYACVLGSPLMIMCLGGMVWWMRRRV